MPRLPRKRGRTGLLISVAAVLGVVGGVCTGYVIQAGRSPDPLPPLSQSVVGQARGKASAALPADQDRKTKTDGDLRKLLLSRPAGAQDAVFTPGEDGWLSLTDYAETFHKPAGAFSNLMSRDFRRAAVTTWQDGPYTVQIRLIQYRDEKLVFSANELQSAENWASQQTARSEAIPGSGSGRVYFGDGPGARGAYQARAHARRGGIVMEIWVDDAEPIDAEKVLELAERQWERM